MILIITITFWHIQRKYIREENPENDKLHEKFRQWLDNHPTLDIDAVAEEDRLYEYAEAPTGEDQASQYYGDGTVGEHYIENEFNGESQEALHDVLIDQQQYPMAHEDGSPFSEGTHGETVASFLTSSANEPYDGQ